MQSSKGCVVSLAAEATSLDEGVLYDTHETYGQVYHQSNSLLIKDNT